MFHDVIGLVQTYKMTTGCVLDMSSNHNVKFNIQAQALKLRSACNLQAMWHRTF